MSIMQILSKFTFASAAQANRAGDAALDFDPTAVLNLETDNAAEAIRDTQPKMRRFKAKVDELQERVDSEQKDIDELNGIIDQNLKDEATSRKTGKNDEADKFTADAATLQTSLTAKEEAHKTTVASLATISAQYTKTEAGIRQQIDQITAKRSENSNLADQLEQSQIVKAAADLRTSLAANPVSFSGRAESKVKAMIHENLSADEVASVYDGSSQVDPVELALKRSKERAAQSTATDALAARRAKLGL